MMEIAQQQQLAGLAATELGVVGWEQGSGLLELLEAPVHLLHLGPVLCPCAAQLLQEVFVGTDQGAVAFLQHLRELLDLVIVLQVLLQLHNLPRKLLHTCLKSIQPDTLIKVSCNRSEQTLGPRARPGWTQFQWCFMGNPCSAVCPPETTLGIYTRLSDLQS